MMKCVHRVKEIRDFAGAIPAGTPFANAAQGVTNRGNHSISFNFFMTSMAPGISGAMVISLTSGIFSFP